ncbi:MAG TPA: Fe-Mn family superoxide dismutase [Candidatus Nanoarchaeia archaeon]|nr:Fe-Mn family superoxide dismutase [Candidatus Nanoarchaeia archaeon]
MTYQPNNYEHLLGIKGFSEQLLKNHLTLYQGYVTNTNKLMDSFNAMSDDAKSATPEFAELKRRFGWEFNGMRLHELYFENLTTEAKKPSPELLKKIEDSFGSIEKWGNDLKATATMRGIGWVILYQDQGRLFNAWINEHDTGHLSGCKPILVLDMFEHAYMLDYQLKKADYIEAFFKAIDWEVVNKRV